MQSNQHLHLDHICEHFFTHIVANMEKQNPVPCNEKQLHNSLREKSVTKIINISKGACTREKDSSFNKCKYGPRKKRKLQNCQTAFSQDGETEGEILKAQVEKNGKKAAKTSVLERKRSVPSVQDHVKEGTEHMFRTHICTECRRCFKTRSHLMEHMRLHFPDPSLQCPTCKHYFTSKSKLRVHMLREAGEKRHQCHLCEYGTVERNTLRRHLISVHGQGDGDHGMDLYKCPTCQKSFRQSQALKGHMKSHHMSCDGQVMPCFQSGCSFQCAEKKLLQKHLLESHHIKTVECRHHACSALFKNNEDMEAHFRTHQAFHCNQCDFSCSNKSLFRQHKRQGHAGETQLSCSFCPFTTFNPVEFEQHLGHLHANEKTHRCPECSFVTAHKRVLKRHMLMHTGEKPHKCALCEFRCRDETYLSKHMLTHSNDKQHMCSECGYVTKWKHYLSVHMRKHTGDLRYRCNQCTYRCHRIDQLNSHKLRHQAKTLICEVCAYSCKRKSELHKHMQFKHSTGKDHQPPLYQCKFCTYTTKYRQALHNHENCKHTRRREFRCALCSYTTFSNTGLFLHKRKAHGYVPGDVKWLETYAEKERENSSVDLMQNFYSKAAEVKTAVEDEFSERQVNSKKTNQLELEKVGDFGVIPEISSSSETANSTGSVPNIFGNEVSSDVHVFESDTNRDIQVQTILQNQCCVLTPLTSTECVQTATLHTETDNQGITSMDVPLEYAGSQPPIEVPQLTTASVVEDVSMSDCDEGSPNEDQTSTHRNEMWEEEPQTLPAHQSFSSSASSAQVTGSKDLVEVMRRQDKDKAKALVLEGKVQMLVVQTQDDVYRCDHCSYVTRKQAALVRHCRYSCQVMKAALQCQDCGLRFKQLRSFNTHCLRKCRALQKKRKVSGVKGAMPARGDDAIHHQNKFCDKNEVGCLSLPGTRDQCEENTRENTAGEKIAKVFQEQKNGCVSAESLQSTNSETCAYSDNAGKFTCKICSFSCTRKATIDRHCAACCRLPAKRKVTLEKADSEQEVENSESDNEQGEQDGENTAGDSGDKTVKNKKQVSCPNCPFVCQQKRALASHEKRGCLKPGEIQCTQCSFVAKSEKSLNHHILVHRKDKTVKQGKRARLSCELCEFTCKQERCLIQHVALKHEGARPFRCRFCDFSTARRHRLEAHESMHTGVGRHCCELCGQTFGTTSKLRLHRQRIHDRQPTHFCSLCDYKGYNPTDVSRHTLSCHTGELNHACSQCKACFSSEVALKQHCKRAHKTAWQQCVHCSFTCNNQASLKAHLQREHPQNDNATVCQLLPEKRRKNSFPQICPDCPFSTGKRLLLIQHIMDEHEGGRPEERSFKCDVCGFSCWHQLVFDQHVRSHGGTCLYKCTECDFSTRNRQKITWHIRIHTGEKPYRCEKCSYSCADPSRLKYHMRIHQEERKYLCPECGYKCKWVNQLKYHMTKHSGTKSYACEECEYRTNRADALRVHRETRHRDERSFICEKCGKAFKTRFLLKTHQKRHSEERPYVCSVCRRSFRWPAGLRHHYLSHTSQLPFRCLYCPYRAKQKFQVVKHLRKHHPDRPLQDGVDKDPDALNVPMQKARLGPMEDHQTDVQVSTEGEKEMEELQGL